jgi:Domain of unknown function (DUF3859)
MLAAFLLLVGASACHAQAARVDRIDILDAGTIVAKVVRRYHTPATATGTHQIVRAITFTKSTTRVPAKMGVRFGFRYKVIGAPAGKAVTLRVVTRFPPQGLRNPAKQTNSHRDEYTRTANIGKPAVDGYAINHSWERVHGRWTFEIWYGRRKLAEKSFTLVKP